MSEDLEALEEWAGALIAKLEPAQRRKLARAVGVDLRRSTVDRIGAQKNPDGSPFTPRTRPPLRDKSGRLKGRVGQMFQKLRRGAFLKVETSESAVAVGFPNAQVSRVARVHQEGLRDKVSRKPGAPTAQYPARRLLGFTDENRARLLDLVMKHLEP